MIIGAQGYTIRDFAKTAEEAAVSLKKLKEIGYNTLQLSGFGDIEPKLMAEIAAENGIKIVVTHTNPDLILNETEKVIANHKIYGCNEVGIGSMPAKYHSEEGVKQFIKDYKAPARLLHENGMQLHYHNHAFEFEKTPQGETFFDMLVNGTTADEMKFIIDVYWVHYAGKSPCEVIKKLNGRIDICHLKDMKVVNNELRMAAVMDGNLNFDEIIAACDEAGVKYGMVEQDNSYEKNPFDELALSYKNLKSKNQKF